jgi:hypothetical protein
MRVSSCTPDFDIRFGAQARSPGVHLSNILKPIALSMGFWKPEAEDEEMCQVAGLEQFSMQSLKRMALGLAWEQWLGPQLTGVNFHFGEVSADGIIMTPDGFDFTDWHLHEFKVTWRSSRRPVEGEWYWLAQVKGYLKGMGPDPEGRYRASLWVYYVNGSYQGGPSPEFLRHDLEFESGEIEGNWRLVVNYLEKNRERIEEAGKTY